MLTELAIGLNPDQMIYTVPDEIPNAHASKIIGTPENNISMNTLGSRIQNDLMSIQHLYSKRIHLRKGLPESW
jgi:hypothetical protein